MRRRWATAAAVVMSLALSGAPMAAQDPSAPEGNAWVTGTMTYRLTEAGVMSVESGVEHYRGGVFTLTRSMSDPRLDGTFTFHHDYDCYGLRTPMPRHGGCVGWGLSEWPEPDGWTGSYSIVEDSSGGQVGQFLEVGTGSNSGWTFAASGTWSDTLPTIELKGLLYQGEPRWGPTSPATPEALPSPVTR